MIDEYGWYGSEVNYRYLRYIIDCCNERQIKLFLLYYPVYKPELYYDQEYCEKIRKELFSDVEFLDYSHWDAVDEERLDAHHLNHKGAQRFTRELCEQFHIK